jgi:hypothetical protein
MTTLVSFNKLPEGEVIALFPDIEADNKGNVQSYMHVGQHGAASPDLLTDLPEATISEFFPLYKELVLSVGCNDLEVINSQTVEYSRNPTPAEIRFGYGATHYADFPLSECLNQKEARFKKRLKGSDGLIYTRN